MKVDGVESHVIVESDDVEEWARRIQQLSSQSPEVRDNNAKLLRDNYNKTYLWRSECERFKRMIQDLAKSRNGMFTKPFCYTSRVHVCVVISCHVCVIIYNRVRNYG